MRFSNIFSYMLLLIVAPVDASVKSRIFSFLSNCTSGPGETRLLLYSPYANATEVRLVDTPQAVIPLNASLQTVFLIHGFLSDGTKDWINDTISALLENQPRNVFAVDWRVGACSETVKFLNIQSYSAAAANTKRIGDYVARCIEKLVSSYSVRLKDIWIIGHSLGAHVAGFAGKALKSLGLSKLGRITGLDPAGPLFRGTNSSSRLDKSDASFVEVTHTSGLLGLQEAVGDVDLYFNGGRFQPSCLLKKPGCSHDRAVDYYIQAIRNDSCIFWGKKWSPIDGYRNTSQACLNSCLRVGPLAEFSSARGIFYVQTNAIGPLYCTNELPTSGTVMEIPPDQNPLDENLFDITFY